MANFNLPAIPVTPLGPLSGVYRGTQYNYGVADLDRQFRDSDLLNLRQQNLYQNELLDNPMKEAERGSKIAEAGYNEDLINSGAKRDRYDSETAGVKSQTAGQNILNQKNEIILASDALTRAAAMPPMALIGQWDELGNQAKALKIKWPEGGATPENMQIVKQMADASRMTVQRLNDLEMENLKFAHTMAANSFNKDASYKQAIDVANIGANASREAANINASAMRQQAIDRDVYQKALVEVSKDGTLSYDTALALGEATLKAEGITMKDLRAEARNQVTREQQSKDKQLSPEAQAARVDKLASDQWTAMAVSRGLNLSKGKLPASDLNRLPPQVAETLKSSGKVATSKEGTTGDGSTGTPAPAGPPKVIAPQNAEKAINTYRSLPDNAGRNLTPEQAAAEMKAKGYNVEVPESMKMNPSGIPPASSGSTLNTTSAVNQAIANKAITAATGPDPTGQINKKIIDYFTGK